MSFPLKNKTIFITGGARGIGKLIALHLLRKGFAIKVCARSQNDLENLKNEADQIIKNRMQCDRLDVTNFDSVQHWLSESIQGTSPWGLVTAAGIYGPMGPFIENDIEQWRNALEINLMGTAACCQIFAQQLVKKKYFGRIVTLSGGGADRPMPNFTSYGATKAAVVRFSETLAFELEPHNITVNSMNPGAFNTFFNDQLIAAGPNTIGEKMYQRAIEIKNGKAADPNKVEGLIEYLMSETSQPVTGLLISAMWDPWQEFHQTMDEINKEDKFRLRRIQPKF